MGLSPKRITSTFINNSSSLPDIIDALNEKLGKKYRSNNNYIQTFLQEFNGYGISLYKANSEMTNWKKLTIGTNFPYNGIVVETPCN